MCGYLIPGRMACPKCGHDAQPQDAAMKADLDRAAADLQEQIDSQGRGEAPAILLFLLGLVLIGVPTVLVLPMVLGWVGWIPIVLGLCLWVVAAMVNVESPPVRCPVCRKLYRRRRGDRWRVCIHCGTDFS